MKRILLIHGIILTIGGIPLIYLGDEVGTKNDYGFMDEQSKSGDNRWVHRPAANWDSIDNRNDPNSIEGQIFQGLQGLLNMRTCNEIFSGNSLEVFNTGNDHILGYIRIRDNQRVIVLSNFSEIEQRIAANFLRMHGLSYEFTNLLTGEDISFGDLTLHPYDFLCLTPK